MRPKVSVVVPTRDRVDSLRSTLSALEQQEGFDSDDYEVIVVDDGSASASAVETAADGSVGLVIRLNGEGRSEARNRGARAARGELLVFVDDDVRVGPSFLSRHWEVHGGAPGVLQVGSIRLNEAAIATPFGRFRQTLEDTDLPAGTGPLDPRRCTAQNMALARSAFEEVGGFDRQLSVAEDQDLALRFVDRGGGVIFVPAAIGIHEDLDALDIRSYCARAERYMQELVRFGARHPDLPDTAQRGEVNGPLRLGKEPIGLSTRKLLKSALLWPPVRACALALVAVLERIAPDSRMLDRLYRALLGAHFQRGYRSGLRSAGA